MRLWFLAFYAPCGFWWGWNNALKTYQYSIITHWNIFLRKSYFYFGWLCLSRVDTGQSIMHDFFPYMFFYIIFEVNKPCHTNGFSLRWAQRVLSALLQNNYLVTNSPPSFKNIRKTRARASEQNKMCLVVHGKSECTHLCLWWPESTVSVNKALSWASIKALSTQCPSFSETPSDGNLLLLPQFNVSAISWWKDEERMVWIDLYSFILLTVVHMHTHTLAKSHSVLGP